MNDELHLMLASWGRRIENVNYPFHKDITFCAIHNRDSGVIDVLKCDVCRNYKFWANKVAPSKRTLGASDKPEHYATVLP